MATAAQRETTRPERPPQDVGCYVYGVMGAEAALTPGVMGLDRVHEVFLIRGESLVAAASLVASSEFGPESLHERLRDLSWLERQVRRHEQILARVRERTTLVPMRLCTIYRDERSVREMLTREHALLTDALRRLRERTEWGVKMYAATSGPEAAIAEDVTAHDAPGGEPGTGASHPTQMRLQGRGRERADVRMRARCELAHFELTQAAVDAKLNPIQPRELTGRDEPMVFNCAYLVDDMALESFASVVDVLGPGLAESGLQLELTGPWTPYNFVSEFSEVGSWWGSQLVGAR